jgi:hypothetical protein
VIGLAGDESPGATDDRFAPELGITDEPPTARPVTPELPTVVMRSAGPVLVAPAVVVVTTRLVAMSPMG